MEIITPKKKYHQLFIFSDICLRYRYSCLSRIKQPSPYMILLKLRLLLFSLNKSSNGTVTNSVPHVIRLSSRLYRTLTHTAQCYLTQFLLSYMKHAHTSFTWSAIWTSSWRRRELALQCNNTTIDDDVRMNSVSICGCIRFTNWTKKLSLLVSSFEDTWIRNVSV